MEHFESVIMTSERIRTQMFFIKLVNLNMTVKYLNNFNSRKIKKNTGIRNLYYILSFE